MRFNAVFQRRCASLPPLGDKQAVDRGGQTIVRPRQSECRSIDPTVRVCARARGKNARSSLAARWFTRRKSRERARKLAKAERRRLSRLGTTAVGVRTGVCVGLRGGGCGGDADHYNCSRISRGGPREIDSIPRLGEQSRLERTCSKNISFSLSLSLSLFLSLFFSLSLAKSSGAMLNERTNERYTRQVYNVSSEIN